METISNILFGLSLVVMIWATNSIFRTNRVYKYRTELLDWTFNDEDYAFAKRVSLKDKPTAKEVRLAKEAIARHGERFKKRLAIYESVPFGRMVNQFWKPIDSFYPEYEEWKKSNE